MRSVPWLPILVAVKAERDDSYLLYRWFNRLFKRHIPKEVQIIYGHDAWLFLNVTEYENYVGDGAGRKFLDWLYNDRDWPVVGRG